MFQHTNFSRRYLSILRQQLLLTAIIALAGCAQSPSAPSYMPDSSTLNDALSANLAPDTDATQSSDSEQSGSVDADTQPDSTAMIDTSPAWPMACTSGKSWTAGNAGSGLMRPGRDCNACHQKVGEGPKFAIAGTVFPHMHDKNDCYGAAAAVIEITDSNNKVYKLKTNSAGNFGASTWQMKGFSPPYRAKVISNGKTRKMLGAQVNGSCNACHTRSGLAGAPGRIVLP